MHKIKDNNSDQISWNFVENRRCVIREIKKKFLLDFFFILLEKFLAFYKFFSINFPHYLTLLILSFKNGFESEKVALNSSIAIKYSIHVYFQFIPLK